MFQVCIMGGKAGNAVAWKTIQYPELEKVRANECGRSGNQDLCFRCPASAFEHLPGRQRRVAFTDHFVMIRGIGNTEVKQMILEIRCFCAGFEFKRFMNDPAIPTALSTIEKTQLSIGIPTRMADLAAHIG